MRPEYKFDSDIWTNHHAVRFYIKYMMRNEKTRYRKFKYFLKIEYGFNWIGPVTSMKNKYLIPAYLDFVTVRELKK